MSKTVGVIAVISENTYKILSKSTLYSLYVLFCMHLTETLAESTPLIRFTRILKFLMQ